MNFIEAIKLAKKGKRIRSIEWFATDYIYVRNGEFIDESNDQYVPSITDMLDEDWAVYEEEKETIRPWDRPGAIKCTNIGENWLNWMDDYRGLREEIRQDMQDLELLNRLYPSQKEEVFDTVYYNHLVDRIEKHTKKLKELIIEYGV